MWCGAADNLVYQVSIGLKESSNPEALGAPPGVTSRAKCTFGAANILRHEMTLQKGKLAQNLYGGLEGLWFSFYYPVLAGFGQVLR